MRDTTVLPDTPELARIQKKILRAVLVSQILGGAGLAAGISVGALLAAQMLGSDALAGTPSALFTLGSAASAYLIGRMTQRRGRRVGLVAGFAAGGAGALGVVAAAALGNLPLLFLSLFIYGAGAATNLQARYAGADLAEESRRGAAVSVALVSTTLGAVAGPNLIAPMGAVARGMGLPELTGPFLLAGAAYLAAAVALLVLLRPDPFLLARAVAAQDIRSDSAVVPRPGRGAYLGAAVMVITQVSMAAIMTMTPVHMRSHHQSLGEVGLVIGLHIGAMFLPSLLTGVLVDRWGRAPMVLSSGVILLAAGLVAAVSPGDSMPLLILALVLLGLGWNFGLIAGTAMVVDATVAANRARTQGSIDVLVALSGAAGGALSGVVMGVWDFQTLALGCGVLAALMVPILWLARSGGAAAPAQGGRA